MKEIIIDQKENCSGCLLCALACSFFTGEKKFNPSEAKISIKRNQQNRFLVELRDDCTRCGMCVNYCHFGVLAKK